MIGITHLCFGIMISQFLSLNQYQLIPVLIGCLLPDIDNPKSLLGGMISGLSSKIYLKFDHRGFTHSLMFAGIISWTALVIPLLWYFVLGILSHLLLDMINPSGIELLWPFKIRIIILDGFIKCGSTYDAVLTILFLILSLFKELLFSLF